MARMSADERRELLVHAAIRVMTRDGVAKATTRAIATEAEMPLGIFHYAFRSKQELMTLVTETIAQQSKSEIDAAVLTGEESDLPAVVRAGLLAYFDHVVAHPQEHLVTYELTTAALRDEEMGVAARMYSYYLGENQKLLEAAAEALGLEFLEPIEVVSRYVFSAMDGLALNYLARGDEEQARAVVDLVARTLLAVGPRDMSGRGWVAGAAGSGFDLDHLPYGVRARGHGADRSRDVGVRVGDVVLDLEAAAARDVRRARAAVRGRQPRRAAGGRPDDVGIGAGLAAGRADRPRRRTLLGPHLRPLADTRPVLAFEVADYVDFYASEHHATNVGRIFRPDGEPLHPSWRHVPIGYHGRAGTVVVSGTDVVRPSGVRAGPARAGVRTERAPRPGGRARLRRGRRGRAAASRSRSAEAEAHLFGVVGLNDWSARDVQAFETVPLGPVPRQVVRHLGVGLGDALAALDAARVDLPGQDPAPSPHLAVTEPAGLDIAVEVEIDGQVVARPPYASMYWSPRQMLAHLTSNGASLRTGDLLGSGTISGPSVDQRGSLLELSWGGTQGVAVGAGARRFLEDGDEVVLRYSAPSTSGGRLTLGEVRGRVLPAR